MGYPGGKAGPGVFHRIISLMPPHEIYIEPFMGGFSIGRRKKPARVNIGIDRDRAAVQSARPPAESQDETLGAPNAETGEQRRRDTSGDARTAANAGPGEAGSPSPASEDPGSPIPVRGSARAVPSWVTLGSRRVINEADGTRWIFDEGDGIAFLEFAHRWWGEMFAARPILIYCDPPYLRHTCASRCRYKYDMDDVDHLRLLRVLQDLNALPDPPMLMISGYDSVMYREMLADWSHAQFQTITRGGKKTIEHVWFNFPVPTVLHDYRYVGTNFRDRERIKRAQQTWVRKLKRLKPYEREALLAAIAQTAQPGLG